MNRNARSAASAAEDETLPETCETKRLDRRRVVLALLAEVRAKLAVQPDGRGRRDLAQKLESLQFAVDRWDVFAPRPEQVSAMLEMLLRLQESSDADRCFWSQ